MRFIPVNELELRKKPCFHVHENFHSWITTTVLPFRLVAMPSPSSWGRQILHPFLAVESHLLHIHSAVWKMLDTLERRIAGSLTSFHLPSSPDQETRPSRMWADFLTAACCWLLGAGQIIFSAPAHAVHYLTGLTGRAEHLGALGKVVSKKERD